MGWRVGFAAVLTVVAAAALWSAPATAQNGRESLSYLVGLAPDGDNFLALRSEPSGRNGRRLAKLDPRTLLSETGEWAGDWMKVVVRTTEHAGLTGWVFARYVNCCVAVEPGERFLHVRRSASLNLRDGPSLGARVVRAMNGGTLLRMWGQPVAGDGRDWLPVEIVTTDARGTTGWTSSRFVECCVGVAGGGPAMPLRSAPGHTQMVQPFPSQSMPQQAFPLQEAPSQGGTPSAAQPSPQTAPDQNASPPPSAAASSSPPASAPAVQERGAAEPAAPGPPGPKSTGTGFLVSASGEVLTNAHVVDNCSEILVGAGRPGTLVRADPVNDLALLRIEPPTDTEPLVLDGSGLRLGDEVVAIGYPLSSILGDALSATSGAVASLNGLAGNTSHLLMTAPIQPGNSGGPLIDARGRVVGVVVSKLDELEALKATGSIPQNMNFAIKATVARMFAEASGARLGMMFSSPSDQQSMPDRIERVAPATFQIRCLG